MQLIVMFLRENKGKGLRRNIFQKRFSERLDISKICGGFESLSEILSTN